MINAISLQPIGTIRSPFSDPAGMPIQASVAKGVEGSIEVLPAYGAGLQDIEGFSHLILLYVFHRSRTGEMLVKPFLGDRLHGVFATRAPARPNPIGISVVRLLGVDQLTLRIEEVDVLDAPLCLTSSPTFPPSTFARPTASGGSPKACEISRAYGRTAGLPKNSHNQ